MNTSLVKEVSSVQQAALSLTIASPDDEVEGSKLLHAIKEATRKLTEAKTEITRPIMESLAATKALFAPRELALKDADKIVREKIMSFRAEQDAARAKIEARVEKGTMKPETAVAKMAEVTAKTEGLRVQTRRQLEIVDASLIPREYLIPDRDAISKALFAKIKVPGAVLKDVKILNVV